MTPRLVYLVESLTRGTWRIRERVTEVEREARARFRDQVAVQETRPAHMRCNVRLRLELVDEQGRSHDAETLDAWQPDLGYEAEALH